MKIPRELKSALSEAEGVLAQRQKIRDAVKQAEEDRRALTGRLTDVQQRLASEEADAALSGGTPKAGPARRELAAVHEDEQVIEARIIGLQAKLSETDEAIVAAEGKLREHDSEFARQQSETDEREWQAAFEELSARLRPIIARRLGLVDAALYHFERMTFPGLVGGSLSLHLIPTKGHGDARQYALLDDPALKKIHDESFAVRRVRQSLHKESAAIRKAREERAAAEAEANPGERRRAALLSHDRTPEVPKNSRARASCSTAPGRRRSTKTRSTTTRLRIYTTPVRTTTRSLRRSRCIRGRHSTS